MKILDKEARAGFPRMRGTRVRATIPISQDLLDRILSKPQWNVEIQEHNRISVSYGVVRVAADIVRVTPDLTVVLSTSWLSRTALRGVLALKPGLQVYLRQQDGLVHVLCGRIPTVARYRYLWRHLADVQARTAPGRLVLNFDLQIR